MDELIVFFIRRPVFMSYRLEDNVGLLANSRGFECMPRPGSIKASCSTAKGHTPHTLYVLRLGVACFNLA